MLLTELNCQHRVEIAANTTKAVGDEAYCRFHGYERITKIWRQEWRVVCADCTFGRWCGQRESAAVRVEKRHKHDKTFHVYDTITASGGTPRKILVKKFLKELTGSPTPAKFDPNEPIPF